MATCITPENLARAIQVPPTTFASFMAVSKPNARKYRNHRKLYFKTAEAVVWLQTVAAGRMTDEAEIAAYAASEEIEDSKIRGEYVGI